MTSDANADGHRAYTDAQTHVVENTPPVLQHHNLYSDDVTLQETVTRIRGTAASEHLTDCGARCGHPDWIGRGFEANRVPPKLETHDRYGHRVDEVTFHPAYHDLMAASLEQGLGASCWLSNSRHRHLERAVGLYMTSQLEAGHQCPITMTFACVPTLRQQPELAEQWLSKVCSRQYDPRNVPFDQKPAVTIGMAMTEKQGGSDVRSNSTRAHALQQPGPGRAYELVGHKYFVSAPMCDAFLMLAQAGQGLSCFLVPRFRPDGSRNPLQLMRLKDKMGNRSNASAEAELRGAMGWLVGDEGRGIRTIVEMVAMTRFDCLVASAGALRQHVTQAVHHARHRCAFGRSLVDQPLMRNVLADLELEAEAAAALAFRVASAMDAADQGDEHEAALARIAVALGKYWVCKRQPGHAYEAMECIGGSGVMENAIMPRLYREAPINAIWEGSGNVQCLDLLRVLARHPEAGTALLTEIQLAAGRNNHLDALVPELEHVVGGSQINDGQHEGQARVITEKLALALQASLLLRHGPAPVSEAFCAARLGGAGLAYGTLPATADLDVLVARGMLGDHSRPA